MHTKTCTVHYTSFSQSSFLIFKTAGRSASETPPGLWPSLSSNFSITAKKREQKERKITSLLFSQIPWEELLLRFLNRSNYISRKTYASHAIFARPQQKDLNNTLTIIPQVKRIKSHWVTIPNVLKIQSTLGIVTPRAHSKFTFSNVAAKRKSFSYPSQQNRACTFSSVASSKVQQGLPGRREDNKLQHNINQIYLQEPLRCQHIFI